MITLSENEEMSFGIETNIPLSECILIKNGAPSQNCKSLFQSKSVPKKACSEIADIFSVELPSSTMCKFKLENAKVSGYKFIYFQFQLYIF